MKNIEEAAEEYLKDCVFERDPINAFRAGVEFAQQWHSVEYELPTKSGKYLVKRKINTGKEWIVLETWTISKGVGYWENSLYITCWRPINIE